LASEELQQLALATQQGRKAEGGERKEGDPIITPPASLSGEEPTTDPIEFSEGDLPTNRSNRNPGRPRGPEDPR